MSKVFTNGEYLVVADSLFEIEERLGLQPGSLTASIDDSIAVLRDELGDRAVKHLGIVLKTLIARLAPQADISDLLAPKYGTIAVIPPGEFVFIVDYDGTRKPATAEAWAEMHGKGVLAHRDGGHWARR